MYLAYWNLREAPFQNVADPRFAYLSAQHHEGLARLTYLVQNKKLGGVLTGRFGIGKSMVLELLAQEVRRLDVSNYVGMDYSPGRLLILVRHLLGMLGHTAAAASLADPMDAVFFLRQKNTLPKHVVLAIDEAQGITDAETLDFLQLLTNITMVDRQTHQVVPAFTLILSGCWDHSHPLFQKESLRQRLQIAWELEPLSVKQTIEYVQHRMRVAGGDIWAFDPTALAELTPARGIPRVINNICDIALMLGYAANLRQVNRDIMRQAVQEAGVVPMRGAEMQPQQPS